VGAIVTPKFVPEEKPAAPERDSCSARALRASQSIGVASRV
jgi:hypothetical protein